MPDRAPSRYERLRLHGAVRGAIIAYGIGAYTFFFSQPTTPAEQPAASPVAGVTQMLLVGVGLQLLVLVVRKLAPGSGRALDRERNPSPLGVFLFELLVDGVTVLLFALATFRGIAQHLGNL
jgi:hypothetical protein